MAHALQFETTIQPLEAYLDTQYRTTDTSPLYPEKFIDGLLATTRAHSGETTTDFKGNVIPSLAINLCAAAEEFPEAAALAIADWTHANFSLQVHTENHTAIHSSEVADMIKTVAPYSFGATFDLYVSKPLYKPTRVRGDIARTLMEDGTSLEETYRPGFIPFVVACLGTNGSKRLYDITSEDYLQLPTEHGMSTIDELFNEIDCPHSDLPVRAIEESEWAKITALRNALASRAISHMGKNVQ